MWPLLYAIFFSPLAQSQITISGSSLPEAKRSPDMLKWSVFTHLWWCSSLWWRDNRLTSPQEPEVCREKFIGERTPSWRSSKLETEGFAALAIYTADCRLSHQLIHWSALLFFIYILKVTADQVLRQNPVLLFKYIVHPIRTTGTVVASRWNGCQPYHVSGYRWHDEAYF